jgi:hypothetical protein
MRNLRAEVSQAATMNDAKIRKEIMTKLTVPLWPTPG